MTGRSLQPLITLCVEGKKHTELCNQQQMMIGDGMINSQIVSFLFRLI